MPPFISHRLINTSLGLLFLGLLLRWPFFFRDVVDWDESTFMLMGRSVLEGHLPYTTIWDVKPPLVFWSYGGLMALIGQSIVAMRVAGWLVVWVIALLTLSVSTALGMKPMQTRMAASLTIILLSFLWSGMATLTEHLALLPMMLALVLLLLPVMFLRNMAIAGVLMGMAGLIRTNLLYVTLALGLYLAFMPGRSRKLAIQQALYYGIGVLTVIVATLVPYLVQAQVPLWINFVVLAPLRYAEARSALLMETLRDGGMGIVLLLMLFFGLHGWAGWKIWQYVQAGDPSRRHSVWIGTVSFLATETSILRSGMGENHYFLQLAPFWAIAIVALGQILYQQAAYRTYILIGLLVLSCNLPLRNLAAEYHIIGDRIKTQQPLVHGSAYAIANYLRQRSPQRLYLMVNQVVYLLLDLPVISPLVAHPSTIGKSYVIQAMLGNTHSSTQELIQLFQTSPDYTPPDYIVTRDQLWYLPPNSEQSQILATTLADHYQLVHTIDNCKIYQLQARQ